MNMKDKLKRLHRAASAYDRATERLKDAAVDVAQGIIGKYAKPGLDTVQLTSFEVHTHHFYSISKVMSKWILIRNCYGTVDRLDDPQDITIEGAKLFANDMNLDYWKNIVLRKGDVNGK